MGLLKCPDCGKEFSDRIDACPNCDYSKSDILEELEKKELLKQISADEKYQGCVFWGPGIYFVIVDGDILTISDDASCSPKGGWFPAIVTGPTEKEKECLQSLMDSLGFDETFFSEPITNYFGFDEEDVVDFFTDNDDEDSLKIYREIERKLKSGETVFESMKQLALALERFDLDGDLYYEWEGEYIHFHYNICEVGERAGRYDNISTAEWIEILKNLDSHLVTAD